MDSSITANPHFLEIFDINDSFKISSLFKVSTTKNHLTSLTSDDKLLFTMSQEIEDKRSLRII